MSNYEHEVRSNIYAIVLSKKNPSILNPESDEEKVSDDDKQQTASSNANKTDKSSKADSASNKDVVIDLDNIDQRIVALSIPEKAIYALNATVDGHLYYLTNDYRAQNFTLNDYDIAKRKAEPKLSDIDAYYISNDGKKLMYSASNTYGIVNLSDKLKVGDGKLNTDDVKVYVDPQKEWRQIFDEIWRIERDFFYVSNLNGANVPAIKKKYEVFLPYVAHRNDLNYLFRDMLGELVVGHMFVGAGDYPETKKVSVGLLGADYTVDNGYYQFKKIYSGLNWNPSLTAPLTQPGITVKEGEYLVAVNGIPLDAKTNIYSLFQNTAGKQTRITVNDKPNMTGAREETVVPIPDETNLRMMNWVEGNRRKVDELSSGKIAYVYMPNTKFK